VDVEHGEVSATAGQELQRLGRVGRRADVEPHALAPIVMPRDRAEDSGVVRVRREVE
jgi:hypothetical protein